jgi:hypothetical protein
MLGSVDSNKSIARIYKYLHFTCFTLQEYIYKASVSFVILLCMNSVLTSQKTHYVCATKINRLALFKEIIIVYCENHTKSLSILCKKGRLFFSVKGSGTNDNHCVLVGG